MATLQVATTNDIVTLIQSVGNLPELGEGGGVKEVKFFNIVLAKWPCHRPAFNQPQGTCCQTLGHPQALF